MYYSVGAFTDAGLDPDHPPTTWAEWLDAAKKLTKPGGERWGLMFPGTYDYCGWLTSALVMQNGGQYYNHDYGGEVYYNAPSTLGALTLLDKLVNQAQGDAARRVRRQCLHQRVFRRAARHDDAVDRVAELCARQHEIAVQGRVSAEERAQRRADRRRLADPAQGQHARAPGRRLDPDQLADQPGDRRRVEPVHRLFRAAQGGLRSARDEEIPRRSTPTRRSRSTSSQYAVPWFDTYNTVAVRKAMEDQVQAILSGKTTPADAVAAAQKNADELLRPYVEQTALKPLG